VIRRTFAAALAALALLPAAAHGAVTVGYGVAAGLTVEGTDAPEAVTISLVAGGRYQVDADVPLVAAAGCVPAGVAVSCDASIGVAAATVRLYGGDDRLAAVCPPGAALRDPGARDETAVTDHFVHLGAGNDLADLGTCGDDAVDGGPGDDTIVGGTGADRLDGGAGRNVLAGGPGDDTFTTAPEGQSVGTDEMRGEGGRDTADYSRRGTPVRVEIDAEADDGAPGEGDLVGTDVERVVGGAGADELRAGAGAAELVGGPAPDLLAGGPARDVLDLRDGGADAIEACGVERDLVVREPADPRPPADCEELDLAPTGRVQRAEIVRGRLVLDRSGRVRVPVACPRESSAACRVRVRASLALAGTPGPQTAARVRFSVTDRVAVRLTPRDARLVRRDRQAVLRIELVEGLPGGGSATRVRWLLAVAR
jgi:Ca2+-binding RTX toxin-like protein